MTIRVSSRRDSNYCLLVKLTRNPPTALGGNRKETTRKRITQEMIVTTKEFQLNFTNKNRSRLLMKGSEISMGLFKKSL